MPILGVIASSFKSSTDSGAMIPLGVFILGANQATLEFTNIPQTYQHLQLRGLTRSTNAGVFWGGISVQFNGDTNTNYSYHNLFGNRSNALSTNSPSQPDLSIPYANVGASASANIFGSFTMDILDYRNTSKFKTIRALNGRDLGGGGSEDRVGITSGNWRSNNAVTSIKITSFNSSFVTGSIFSLYGIK